MYNLEILNEKINMPPEACNLIYNVVDIMSKDSDFMSKFELIRSRFFNGESTRSEVESLAAEKNVEPLLLLLVFCELYSETTLQKYNERGISEEIFFDSMKDLTVWAKVCKRDYGAWGMQQYDWVASQLRLIIFKLGRMQFHKITYSYNTIIVKGVMLQKGDKVINMHIPEGEPFTKEKRLDSYRKARAFFNMDTIVCGSWLLYPKHFEFLPPTSNILDFMRDFDVITYGGESDDLSNMWRIWGRRDKYIPSELARDTGLRRAYADWIEKNGKVGEGYGIIVTER